jgi:hypothetical protein
VRNSNLGVSLCVIPLVRVLSVALRGSLCGSHRGLQLPRGLRELVWPLPGKMQIAGASAGMRLLHVWLEADRCTPLAAALFIAAMVRSER